MHWRLTKIAEKNPCKLIYLVHDSSHARKSKTVLNSGLHAVGSGFQVLNSSLCWWNLDSGFQSLVGFQIPNSRVSDSTSKIFPNAGLHEQKCPGFRNPHYARRHDSKRYSGYQYQIYFHCLAFTEIFKRAHEHRKHLGLRYQDVAKRNSRLPVIFEKNQCLHATSYNRRLWHFHIKTFLISGFQTL